MLNLRVTLEVVACIVFASTASGQGTLVPDKPYYKVGETARIEYRLPLDEGRPILIANGKERGERMRMLLQPSSGGVVELSELTSLEGPVRLYVENTELEDPPSIWIWVFPDIDPWPNALSIAGGNRVRIFDRIAVTITPPAGTGEWPPELFLYIVRPAFAVEGGAVDQVEMLDSCYDLKSDSTLNAPFLPGKYEIRLSDAATGANLACLPIEVMFPRAEDVVVGVKVGNPVQPNKLTFTVTGLISSDLYNATIRHTETKRIVSSFKGSTYFMLDSLVGPHELVVTSDIGDEPIVVRHPLESDEYEDEKQSGALKILNSGPFEIGESVTIKIAALEEIVNREFLELIKKHSNLAIRIVTDPFTSADWPNDFFDTLETIAVINPVDFGQELSFKISRPGFYLAELGAMGKDGWVSDIFFGGPSFKCMYPVGSGSIKLDNDTYQPGESVHATLVSNWPAPDAILHDNKWSDCWVTILTPSGRRIKCDVKGGRVSGLLPLQGGVFQMRWYDRGRLIGTAPIRVPIQLEPDRLRLVGGPDIEYGEPIRVEVELDDRPLFSSKDTTAMVVLMRRGEMSPTGTWKRPMWTRGSKLAVRESGTFEFAAPFPGRYEVRLIVTGTERWSIPSTYILARIPLDVPGPRGAVPVPINKDAPEPTDLPAGSALLGGTRVTDIHCAEYQPLIPSFDALPVGESILAGDKPAVIKPKEMTLVRYPVRTHYFPAFVSGVDVSQPEYDFHGASWKNILPVDVANKYGKKHRLLMIYGEQLLGASARTPTIESGNPKVAYEVLKVGPKDWNDRYNSDWGNTWERCWESVTGRMKPQDKESILGLDKVLVMATVDEGVIAGLKEFKINGIAGEWYLRKGNVSANVRFLRQAVTGSSPEMQGAESYPLDYIFAQDRVILEVVLSHDVDLGEIPVVLGINGAPLDQEFPAIWVPGRPGVYRTEPIRFMSTASGQKAKLAGVTDLRIEQNATIIALVPRTAPVNMLSPAVSQFTISPNNIGQHWKSAVRQAAVIAKKLEIFDRDPKAVLNETAGQVPFRHIPLSNKVDVTVGDLAAMILLRQTFIASMEGIVAELQKIDRDIGDDPFLLRMFYLSMRPHIADPNSPFRQIMINPPVDTTWSGLLDISFAKAYDEAFLRRSYPGVTDRRGWILKATRQALDRYLEAAEFALEEAKNTDPAELEDLLDLVSLGFDKVAQRALPNVVKLTGTQSTGLRWEPDMVARAFVAGVHGRGLQYRANQDLADAEINIAIAAASVAMFVPVGIPLQAVAVVASAGMVAETFLHMIPEAVRRNDAAKFALGSVAILGVDRLNYAESKVIPEGMLVIAGLGSLVGLGGDFLILAQTVKLHRAAVAVAHALPDVERSGLYAFMRLNTKEQAALAVVMHDARLASVTRPGRMTAAETRALKVYRQIRDEMAGLQRVPFRRGALGGALRKVKVYRTAAKQSFLDGGPPELEVGSSWFGLIIGKELGVGSYARVYALPDYPDRVLKVFRPGKEGISTLERAEHVAGLLKDRGIPQLEILGSSTKSEFPCLIQQRLAPEMKTFHVKFEGIEVAKSDGAILEGRYAGLKEFSRYDEMTGERTLRKLPRPMQRAYLKLITDMSEAKDGARGLIWEDAHLENVYFRQTGPHKWEAGILDQDRIMTFGADLSKTHPMYQLKVGLVDGIPIYPYSGNMKIFSLVDQVKRPYDIQSMVIKQNGHIWPDARFFMEKMLENKNFLVFDPSTKTWSSKILDMDIVEDFFPAIREHAGYDFNVHMPVK